MTSVSLAQSYLRKAVDRLDILDLLHAKGAHSDVVREAQEIVELALKAILREAGIEPPKLHDVGDILLEQAARLGAPAAAHAERLAAISRRLRKERELAFYGDVDFIPTEEYTEEDSRLAIADARFTVELARGCIPEP